MKAENVRMKFKRFWTCKGWKADIEADITILNELLGKLYNITPEHDTKLNELKKIISKKLEKPLNEGNKKFLIFSAFADTATYIYKNIAPWLKAKYGLYTAKVEGGSGNNACELNCSKGTDTLLTMFSPVSKSRDKLFNVSTKITGKANVWSLWGEDAMEDIDCLIGTDCISEGQNLQDCDMCINYDIHWNPVRIVQRFGRIDRLGSKNEEIQLVNFWPTISLDEYIKLSSRIENQNDNCRDQTGKTGRMTTS
jgi:SNF2 family DNA or RNA helicase